MGAELAIFGLFALVVGAFAINYIVEKRRSSFKDDGGIDSLPDDLSQFKMVQLKRRTSQFNPTPRAYLADISLGGAKIIIEWELKKNENIEMHLETDDNKILVLVSRMAWQRPLGGHSEKGNQYHVAGLDFGKLPSDQVASLTTYIKGGR